MHDEPSMGILHHVGVAIADGVDYGLCDHEQRMHVPSRPPEPLNAVPFPDRHIPDVTLAQMVEMLETLDTPDLGIAVLSRTFDYPESLVLRELADYKSRFRGFILSRANA